MNRHWGRYSYHGINSDSVIHKKLQRKMTITYCTNHKLKWFIKQESVVKKTRGS